MSQGLLLFVLLMLFSHELLSKASPPNLRYSLQAVADAVNLARTNPENMKNYIKQTWYDDLDSKKGVCVVMSIRIRLAERCPEQFDSFFKFYAKQKPLPPMKLNKAVTWGAYKQAQYMATQTHKIGHEGPLTWLQRYGNRYSNASVKAVAENVMYEERLWVSAKRMIGIYILDDGVKSRGHRTNIYAGYDNLGVGMAPDSKDPNKIYLVLGFSHGHDCGKCDELPEDDVIAMGWPTETKAKSKSEPKKETNETKTSGDLKSSRLYQTVSFVVLMLGIAFEAIF